MKTKSEQIFEDFLAANNVTVEKIEEATTHRPDYLVSIGVAKVIFKLKELTTSHRGLERAGAHLYDTGGMRRVHLRGKKNIAKRALIHAAAFNLSLILRIVLGAGTVRQAANRLAPVCFWFLWLDETGRREHQHPTCPTWLPQSLLAFILMRALNPPLSTDC